MTVQEYETFKQFIDSNEMFLEGLKNNKKQFKDSNVQIQLLIIYLKINIDELKKITDDELLIDLIENDDYYINGENICNESVFYSLTNLKKLMILIETNIQTKNHEKVIEVDFVREAIPSMYKKTKSIEEEPLQIPYITKGERRYIFERTLSITPETEVYIEDVENDFRANISYIIYCIFNNEEELCIEESLKLVYSLLKLYPLLMYYKDEFPLEIFNIPQNEIALIKATYCNDYIRFKEKKIDECEHKKEILRLRKEYISRWTIGPNKRLEKIEAEIDRINRREFSIGIELYEVKHTKYNYNEQIFCIILEAIKQFHVDMRMNGNDPLITLFNIENNNVENLIDIHLSTFSKLIDINKIREYINSQKQLKKVDNN